MKLRGGLKTYNRKAAKTQRKIIFCRKARKNARIKNHNNAFLCALRVFCGKDILKFPLRLRASAVNN
jgi:hypothetical protein